MSSTATDFLSLLDAPEKRQSTKPNPIGRPKDSVRIAPKAASELQVLQARHREMVRLHATGLKNVEIAEALGVSAVSVGQVLQSELAQQKIAEIQGAADHEQIDLLRYFKDKAKEAADVCYGLFNDPAVKAELRHKAAADWLDRAGYSPIRKEAHINGFVRPEDLETLYERARDVQAINVESEAPTNVTDV